MPTLFRLLTVIGVAAGLVYGAMLAVVTVFKPEPRTITQVVALPQSVDLHSGRSAAEALNSQAAALVHHEKRRHKTPH